jgi:hypothetical protein
MTANAATIKAMADGDLITDEATATVIRARGHGLWGR